MFHRILVVLDDERACHPVLNTALQYARVNRAKLCVVKVMGEQRSIKARFLAESDVQIEIVELFRKTDSILIEVAEHWNADLIVVGYSLDSRLIQALPCSVLIVQQNDDPSLICGATQSISITMQIKSRTSDVAVRDRLERLLELSPDA